MRNKDCPKCGGSGVKKVISAADYHVTWQDVIDTPNNYEIPVICDCKGKPNETNP